LENPKLGDNVTEKILSNNNFRTPIIPTILLPNRSTLFRADYFALTHAMLSLIGAVNSLDGCSTQFLTCAGHCSA